MRKITLGTLNISDKGKEYVNDALNRNRLSAGKYTATFERQFALAHESEHAIFMNSGTSALQVALAALKEVFRFQDGDEVLVPACTFIATSNIVLQNNLKPVFVDVDPRSFNINPSEIERHITSRTKCIIPVHLFGQPCQMDEIMRIANKYNLYVIEDSCETMFAKYRGKSVGSFGNMACFSTYVAHLVVGGVGGIITTQGDRLAEISRSLMAHGRDSIYTNIDDDNLVNKDTQLQMIERRYSFDRVGYSYRATELEAAIALSELERADQNIRKRRANAELLTRKLSDLGKYGGPLQLPVVSSDTEHSFMMYPIVAAHSRDNRGFLLEHLENNGIETRYLFPLLSQPIYKRLFPGLNEKYPVAKRLGEQGFFIGMHQNLSTADINYISEVFHAFKY